MNRFISSLALGALVFGNAAFALPACAQGMMGGGVPVYNAWQSSWDQGRYDRRHVMLGRVVSFSPYRLTISRRGGNQMTIDLKGGTIIRPTGATPQPGERIAAIGYWSHGTFIVNRLVVRP